MAPVNPVKDYNRTRGAGQLLLEYISDTATPQALEDMQVLRRNYFRERPHEVLRELHLTNLATQFDY